MITKQDCLLLISELKDKGEDVSSLLQMVINDDNVSISALKQINEFRQLDLTAFYEKIRKSYNQKKSKLYLNLVREIDDPNEVLTTLSAMLTQILLFSKNVGNKPMFLRHARASEISYVLSKYFTDYDITVAMRLLKIIKADIKCLDEINNRSSKSYKD